MNNASVLFSDQVIATVSDDLIENLKKRRDVGIIIIAHNLAHVLLVADRVLILSRGRVIAEREAKETNIDDVTEIISKRA